MRRIGPALFLTLAFTYVQFFQAATWGAACRFDLARAIVERGELTIDAYHENTGDKAFFAGHYYSDKGPLPSFLAAPAVAAMRATRNVTGRPESDATWLTVTAGLAAFLASGLPAALAGWLFFVVLRARGVPESRAAVSAPLVFLATPLFPYATLLQGHALAAAGVLLFFHAMFPPHGSPSPRRVILGGVAATVVLATEILAMAAILVLAAVALARAPREALRCVPLLLAGAMPGFVMVGCYNQAAFGSPFSFGYQFVALPFFQEKMAGGLFGIGAPDPVVAAKLVFGPYRGLLFAAPVLLAALGGLFALLRDRERHVETAAILAVFLVYLALNSGYSSWHGGWAIGARHLVPAIPLLGLGLPAALRRFPRAVMGLALVSALFMLAAVSVQPEVPEEVANPLFDHLLPRLAAGELSVGEQGFDDLYPARKIPDVPDRWDAFLIGEALRLPGVLAVIPVLVPLAIFGRRLRAK